MSEKHHDELELSGKRNFFINLLIDEEPRPRTFWRLAIFGGGLFACFGAFAVVGQIFLQLYIAAVQPKPIEPFLVNAQQWALAIAGPALLAVSLLLTWFCRRYLDRRSMWSAGFKPLEWRWFSSPLDGFWWGVFAILIAYRILFAIGAIDFRVGRVDLYWWVMIPTLITMAMMEEVVFRSYILQNFREIGWEKRGLLFSSVLFWLAHANNFAAWSTPWVGINLFAAGILLGLAYIVSENIWFPTALHFAWNFAQGLLLGIPVSGIQMDGILNAEIRNDLPIWITGGKFGLEGSAVATFASGSVSLVLLLVLLRRRIKQGNGSVTQVAKVPPNFSA